MEIVVNEWLLEYMKPKAKQKEREAVNTFFEKIDKGQIKIVVRRPSAFLNKCHKYRKIFHGDPYSRTALKRFIATVLKDTTKCRFVDDNELSPLSSDCKKILTQGNLNSDAYLFEAANTTKQKVIITTDAKLAKAFSKSQSFQVTLLSNINELCK